MANPSTTPVFYVNSYGFVLSFKVANLNDATQMTLDITKPNGNVVTRTLGSADIDNNTKTVTYLVQENDLNQPGTYKVRLTDTTPGRNIPSTKRMFRVRQLD